MAWKMLGTAILLAVGCLILSLIPAFPKQTIMQGYESSQIQNDSGNPKSPETTPEQTDLVQSDSVLPQDSVEAKVADVGELPQTPIEYISEKTENQTLPVRLEAVVPPSEFEPIRLET